jgi:uncharacterized membrane protein
MLWYEWKWWQTFLCAIAENIFPSTFILLFFRYGEKFLQKFTFWTKIMDWLFARTRKKADSRIKKYHYIGLFAFVALPVPFIGTWTGALIAYLFDLKFTKSLPTIFIGLIRNAMIISILTLYISRIFTYLGINIKE